MNIEHKYADVLRWVAEGKHVECRVHSNNPWARWPNDFSDEQIALVVQGLGVYEFRVAPETVLIGEYECEAPVLKPSPRQNVWHYSPGTKEVSCFPYVETIPWMVNLANSGMLFPSKESALKANKAIAKLLKGEK